MRGIIRGAVPEQNTTLYWAVPCSHCTLILAQAVVTFDTKGVAIPKAPANFQAHCPVCWTDEYYRRDQVVAWMGPPPALNFQTNPAFQ
jgi:hypothetical protein